MLKKFRATTIELHKGLGILAKREKTERWNKKAEHEFNMVFISLVIFIPF